MRKRTRRRRRKTITVNKFAFLCLILSIIIVCAEYAAPREQKNENAKINEQTTASQETVTAKAENEKNEYKTGSVASILFSEYSDIEKAESRAKELLENASNDGKIYSEDYSSKNATSSAGVIYLRNTTKNHSVNIEEYLNKKINADIKKNKPVVLVYHTHSSESYQTIENGFYSNSLVADPETFGVVRVGDALCNALEECGYKTLHDKNVYDTSYSGAFDRSRAKISEILRANPSIQIVIDLHRDSISRKDGSKVKTVTEIDGKKVAQIQITAGCEDGAVTDFPNWEKNLTFAVHLQNKIAQSYPHAARPLLFCARKYNMDLVSCALNIDIGTQANTVREAVRAAEILGKSLAETIKECE